MEKGRKVIKEGGGLSEQFDEKKEECWAWESLWHQTSLEKILMTNSEFNLYS